MQQSLRSHAHANRLGDRDLKMIKQCDDIVRALFECKALGWIGRSPMPAQIGHDDSIALRVGRKNVFPIAANTHASVQEQ